MANARPPMSAEPEQKRLCKRQRTDKLGGNSLVRERKSEGAMSTNSDGVADMMADVVVDEVSQGQSGTRQISRSHDPKIQDLKIPRSQDPRSQDPKIPGSQDPKSNGGPLARRFETEETCAGNLN